LEFPCNQFGNQEPQAAVAVEARVPKQYGVAFHVMAKVEVNGVNSHGVFKYLKHATPAVPRIAWNFGVYYLVGRDGYARAFPDTSPARLAGAVRAEL
jgi:glutathione peroxidase